MPPPGVPPAMPAVSSEVPAAMPPGVPPGGPPAMTPAMPSLFPGGGMSMPASVFGRAPHGLHKRKADEMEPDRCYGAMPGIRPGAMPVPGAGFGA